MKTKLLLFLIAALMPITQLTACHSGKKSDTGIPVEKAFYLGGLKYETWVKLSIGTDGKVSGTVASNEYFVDGETVSFTGMITDGLIEVTFNGEPPVVGDNSEWTDKPWRIEEREGKEVLIIPFHAKSYETFEWEDTEYEFEAIDATLCYEDESRRVIGFWQEDYDGFIIRVEAKQEGVKSFTVHDATAFECVIGDLLVLSNGTSNVRMLGVYDLNTCYKLFEIEENFMGEITPDDDQTGFTFYRYTEEMPLVRWYATAGEWCEVNIVPAELFNADFEKKVEEVSAHLFNGMQLAALQKTRVSIESREVTYLDEYKWSYIE